MLVLPKPAKDEFALGYIGRLCHVNLRQSLFEMMRALVVHYDLESRAGAYVQALSMASRMDLARFLDAHTLAHVTIPREPGPDDRERWRGSIREFAGWRSPFRLHKKHAYFCLECIDQQRQDFGFSYWNRMHQLPGVYWCPWHKKELLPIRSTYMSKTLPSNETVPLSPPLGYEREGKSIIHRYGEIMMEFLGSERRYVPSELASRLRADAATAGLNVDKNLNTGRYLSDLAFESFPKWWLTQEYKGSPKSMGQYFPPIDDALGAPEMGNRAYAVAIAILCELGVQKTASLNT